MIKRFSTLAILVIIICAAFPVAVAAQTPTVTPPPPPGLVSDSMTGCFDMEEGTGTRIDATGQSSGLVVRSGNSSTDRRTTGLNTYAVNFDGAIDLHNVEDEQLYIFNGYELAPASSFTIFTEVYPDFDTGGLQIIMSRSWWYGHEYQLWFDGSTNQYQFQFLSNSPTNWTAVKSEPVSIGEWHLITAWWDKENQKIGISVNGVEVIQDSPYVQTAPALMHPFIVGGQSADVGGSTAYGWRGRIDTTALWRRALLSDERTWLYNGATGRFCSQIMTGSLAPIVPIGNMLTDGDMEQQPGSNFWFIDTPHGAGDFGRLNDGNLLQVGYGDPRCDNGWQIIGNTSRCSWSILEYYNDACKRNFSAIRQTAVWPGGIMYWRFSAKGLPSMGWERDVNITIWVTHKFTNAQTVLYKGPVGNQWTDFHGSTNAALTGGTYTISVFRELNNNLEDDAFVLDDFVIDTKEVNLNVCSEPATESTQFPPTATPTAAPPGSPGPNLVENCGFSQGSALWTANSGAYVIYGEDNYAHVEKSATNPGFTQPFNWLGGQAYVSFQAAHHYNVYFRNTATGQTYSIGGGQVTNTLQTYQGVVVLPPGMYDLRLHNPSGDGPSEYDNLTVSSGNFTTCDAGMDVTPTPPPTETPNATPTMWPTRTQRPTNTVPAGQPSSTALPTLTPFPTFTQKPPNTNTPRPSGTVTPWATWTAQPTYTMFPTYTPNALGTIEPSPTLPTPPPPPPPPGYYADCNRPTDPLDLAAWEEYEKCQILSFFSMSPNAVGTVAAVPTMFAGREPFGTIGEVSETNKQIQELVNRQDWTESLPGTKDSIDPSMFLAPAADSPLVTGHFDFTKKSEPISQECSTSLKTVVGPQLAPGMCWAFNLLKQKGIMPWLQLIINIISLAVFALYIWKKWIDAGAGG